MTPFVRTFILFNLKVNLVCSINFCLKEVVETILCGKDGKKETKICSYQSDGNARVRGKKGFMIQNLLYKLIRQGLGWLLLQWAH